MKINNIVPSKSKIDLMRIEKYINIAKEGGFSFREYLVDILEGFEDFTYNIKVDYLPGNALIVDYDNTELILHKISLIDIITSEMFIDSLCSYMGIIDKKGYAQAQGEALYTNNINNFMDLQIT